MKVKTCMRERCLTLMCTFTFTLRWERRFTRLRVERIRTSNSRRRRLPSRPIRRPLQRKQRSLTQHSIVVSRLQPRGADRKKAEKRLNPNDLLTRSQRPDAVNGEAMAFHRGISCKAPLEEHLDTTRPQSKQRRHRESSETIGKMRGGGQSKT